MNRTKHPIQLAIALAITTLGAAHAQTLSMNVNPQPMITLNVSGTRMISIGLPVKDELLAGTEKFAQGATSVTEINLDPNTMGMMNAHGKEADLAHKMNLMVVHTYTYDKPGMYRQEDVDAFRKKLEDGSWSCYVHTRSESGTSDICSRPGADKDTNEMVIFSSRAQKLTFIHMSGKMSLNELSEMSGQANSLAPHHLTPMVIGPMAPMAPTGPISPGVQVYRRRSTPATPAQPAPAPAPAPTPAPVPPAPASL